MLIQKNLAKYVYEYDAINDCLIKMTFDVQSTKVYILQTYISTCDRITEEVEEIYQLILENISNIPKEEPIIMNDINNRWHQIKTKAVADCRSDQIMLQAEFRIILHNKIYTNKIGS